MTVCPQPWLSPQGFEESRPFDARMTFRRQQLVQIPICKDAVVNSNSNTSSMTVSGPTNNTSLPAQASTTRAESVSQASLQGSIPTNLTVAKTSSATTTVSATSIQTSTTRAISVSETSHQRVASTNSAPANVAKTASASASHSSSSSSSIHSNSRTSLTNKSSAPVKDPSATSNHPNTSINPANLSNSSRITHISASNQVPNQRRSAPTTISSPSDASSSDSASDVVEIPAQNTVTNSSSHHSVITTDAFQPNPLVSGGSSDQARQISSAVSAVEASCSPGNLTQSIHGSGGIPHGPVPGEETDGAAVISVS